MGAASTDRLVKGRQSRKRKARWPGKYKRLKDSLEERAAVIEKAAADKVRDADKRVADITEHNRELQQQIDTLYANGPAAVEVVHVKQRNIIVRLWWAVCFALTRKLWFERM